MPSRYTLSGFSFYTSSITGDPIIDYNASLAVEAPTNGGYVQYSLSGPQNDPDFNFTSNATSVEVTGSGFLNDHSVNLGPTSASVVEIPWANGTTQILAVLVPFGTTLVVMVFPLGGASTAHINTNVEFIPFLRGFEDYRVIDDGQFAPDQVIELADIALLSAVEIPRPPGLTEIGNELDDLLIGDGGDDRLVGHQGEDTLRGGDGADTLNGGDGDDFIFGGSSADDLRDVIYAGAGNDSIDGGYGNDLIYGQDGNDSIAGGFGADELQGQAGDDVITGSAFSDLIYGGAGDDFVNGGFGHDRVNGGSGADKFYHLGIADHGSDWIQDYAASEGDVLFFGNSSASVDDFQVNLTNAGGGDSSIAEAFVIYRPTGQIIWALVDGAGQDEINLRIGGEVFDLMA